MLPRVALRNGVQMPVLGLGTWQLKGEACQKAVRAALQAKYSLFDSANIYRNGKDITAALLSEGRVPKGDGKDDSDNAFIASKISPDRFGYDNVMKCHKEIRDELGIPRLDLLLLLWPGRQGLEPSSAENRNVRTDSWKAMEKLYADGEVRAIGVSNYLISHLEQLKEDGATVMPMVNQLELHPYCFYDELDEWAKKNKMVLQAYASLGSGKGLLKDPVLGEIAKSRSKSPAQVLLRWGLQRNYCLIPRSSDLQRIKENAAFFDFSLSEEEMKRLNALRRQKHFRWNPEQVA